MVDENNSAQAKEELNQTDILILDCLSKGRETTGSLSEKLDKSSNYIRDRLEIMRLKGWVEYHHKPTGLHKIVKDPRND